jgi:hypothetical protein
MLTKQSDFAENVLVVYGFSQSAGRVTGATGTVAADAKAQGGWQPLKDLPRTTGPQVRDGKTILSGKKDTAKTAA